MKTLRGVCLVLALGLSSLAAYGDAPQVLRGKLLETQNVDGYTYLRLKTLTGEAWAAVPTATLKLGADVMVENAAVMSNFESKTLKRTFPTIAFGTLAGVPKKSWDVAEISAAHAGLPKQADLENIKVTKATGANARTVAELVTHAADNKDKAIVVSGKVVKFNGGIMGKNWVHLRDGTGAAADSSNDVLITTQDIAKVGDVVTVSGVVRTNKDFGSGYAYKVIVEDAKLKP